MTSTTVAPPKDYTSASITPTPDNYAQFGAQTQVAVNLVDSNLWLVDSSKLAAQITNTSATVPLLDWTVKSQTTVSLDNITAVDRPVNLATGSQSGLSQYLSADMPLDTMLQLSAVSGGVQLGGSASNSGSGGSSGFTSSGTSSLISTGSFQPGGESGGGIPSFSSSTGTQAGSTPQAPGTPTDGSNISTGTSSGTSTGTSISTSAGTPQITSTSTSKSTSTIKTVPNLPPSSSSNPPTPVPFDLSSSLGLTILIAIWGGERMVRFWHSQLRFRFRND